MVSILKKITVEPILFIYLFSYMLINILEKDIYQNQIGIYKYGPGYDVGNFSIKYPEAKEQVIKELSIFLRYNYMTEYLIILLLMPLYISFNKGFGSKAMILLCLFGRLAYMISMCINIYYANKNKYVRPVLEHESVYNLIYNTTIPTSMIGSPLLLFANCFNLYIASYRKNKANKENIPLMKTTEQKETFKETAVEESDKNTIDPITYRKKKYNYDQINKLLKQNTILNIKSLIQLFENHGKSFERIINSFRNGITIHNIQKNIGIVYQNLLIISKILKISLQLIENNENVYKYSDLIECIYSMGVYENGYIKTYNEKYIDRIVITPKALAYNTTDYEYIKALRNVELVKQNLDIINKQVINLSDTTKEYYNVKTFNIENAEYICRHIRHLENLMRSTLHIIDDKTPQKVINVDLNIDTLGSSAVRPITVSKQPETTIQIPVASPKQNDDNYVDLGLLHIIYLLAIPIGIYTGKVLYSTLQSYIIIYMINIVCISIIMLYTCFRFSFDFSKNAYFLDTKILKRIVCFDYKNKKDLIVIYICIFCYMVAREENNVLYLYTKAVFDWTYVEYSLLKTIQIMLSTFILLITYIYVTLYNKNIDPKKIIAVSCILYLIGQVLYLTSGKDYILVLIIPIIICSASGTLILNNIRSFIQYVTSDEERIVVFVVCGFIEQTGVLLFELLLQTMFIIFKKSIFVVSIFSHCIILGCILLFLSKKK